MKWYEYQSENNTAQDKKRVWEETRNKPYHVMIDYDGIGYFYKGLNSRKDAEFYASEKNKREAYKYKNSGYVGDGDFFYVQDNDK